MKAVEETGIVPADHPEFSDVHFVEGEPPVQGCCICKA